MTPEHIHDLAIGAFHLIPRQRSDGWSYWTPETATAKPLRILRVSRRPDGSIAEVKLAISSGRRRENVFLAAPHTEARVRDAIAGELAGGC